MSLGCPLKGYFGPLGGYFEACGSLSAALYLECYVLLHYFERGNGPNVGVWDQVSLVRAERSATARRFGPKFRAETRSRVPGIGSFTSGKRLIP